MWTSLLLLSSLAISCQPIRIKTNCTSGASCIHSQYGDGAVEIEQSCSGAACGVDYGNSQRASPGSPGYQTEAGLTYQENKEDSTLRCTGSVESSACEGNICSVVCSDGQEVSWVDQNIGDLFSFSSDDQRLSGQESEDHTVPQHQRWGCRGRYWMWRKTLGFQILLPSVQLRYPPDINHLTIIVNMKWRIIGNICFTDSPSWRESAEWSGSVCTLGGRQGAIVQIIVHNLCRPLTSSENIECRIEIF